MGSFHRLCVIIFICCTNVSRIGFLIEPLCRFLLALTVQSNTSKQNKSNHLMEVQVRVISNEICGKAYSSLKGFVADNRVLCVASINPEEQHC